MGRLLYPLFGLAILGAYGVSATTASDLSSVRTHQTALPPAYRAAGAYRSAPIIWRTGFHGPAAFSPRALPAGSGGSYGGRGYIPRRRRYGGGSYGGFSFGK